MNVWVFLGSLFILVCVCTVVYAICKLVSIVDETHDRTETLARIAVKDERKVSELGDDLSALAERVYSDSAEISALDDIYGQLLKRIDNLEKKLEKEGTAIERKTGRTGKEG